MAQITGVILTGNRESLIDYVWDCTPTGTALVINVTHDTDSGVAVADQVEILEAVRDSTVRFAK
jgi:ABC-type nitrate/sulfonate/bicarbonate transport system ATPase subunit